MVICFRYDPATLTSHVELTFPKLRISENYLMTTNFEGSENLLLNMIGHMKNAGAANLTFRTIRFLLLATITRNL